MSNPLQVETPARFSGVVHSRDYRRPACTSYGTGETLAQLDINMVAEQKSEDYCGVFLNEASTELGTCGIFEFFK